MILPVVFHCLLCSFEKQFICLLYIRLLAVISVNTLNYMQQLKKQSLGHSMVLHSWWPVALGLHQVHLCLP